MTITIGDKAQVEAWLAAESKLKKENSIQPEGSVTCVQYAEVMKCSIPSARRRLYALWKSGLATRVHFHPGDQSGASYAYSLKNEESIPTSKKQRHN